MRERRAIRGLIIKGALVTLIGGTFITIVLLGWDFRTSILFGTLIVVTGPTVITPLLKRIRVHHGVSTILEAEGILLDAIGAIVAVVALEIEGDNVSSASKSNSVGSGCEASPIRLARNSNRAVS